MNRKIREPLTFSKHEKLQAEINEMMIAIKLHHMNPPERSEKPEQWAKAQSNCACPTWETVLDILNRSYREMNECRYNPVKY